MYKKIIILLFLGTEVISAQKSIGITRALVIGISHYQDSDIPDMQMAHRDAELFATFLRPPFGLFYCLRLLIFWHPEINYDY